MWVLCPLGRVLLCNHSTMLHMDARSREALATNRGPCTPLTAKAAWQFAVPVHTYTDRKPTPHILHTAKGPAQSWGALKQQSFY